MMRLLRRSAHRPASRSLSVRLAVSYAGMAALTSMVLGGLLLAILTLHFERVNRSYLDGVAMRTRDNLTSTLAQPVGDPASVITTTIARTAYGTDTRIQALDAAGRVVVDSGHPQDLTLPPLTDIPADPGPNPAPPNSRPGEQQADPALPPPPNRDSARSSHSLTVAAPPDLPMGIVALRFSEQSTTSGGILVTVGVAWTFAAAVAVILAASVGLLVSSGISRPLTRLIEATDRMAAGELTSRAPMAKLNEAAALAASFNAMADRVQTTVASLRRFVSDAAHQLGTPLTALGTDLELLADSAVDPDDQRIATRAAAQQQRLVQITTGLLALSRLDAEPAPTTSTPVDLVRLVAEALDAITGLTEQAGLTLIGPAPGQCVIVNTDRERLLRAIECLLDNAAKFTPAGGTINAGCSPYSSPTPDGAPIAAVIWVQDDGPGIPQADWPHVFDRFYRAPNTSAIPGSGLGLAIAAANVKSIGGTLQIAPTNRGTRVEIVLPIQASGKLADRVDAWMPGTQ